MCQKSQSYCSEQIAILLVGRNSMILSIICVFATAYEKSDIVEFQRKFGLLLGESL